MALCLLLQAVRNSWPTLQSKRELGDVLARAAVGRSGADAIHAMSHAYRAWALKHPARYEARVGDNHHHVVCRSCGAIADVDCAVGYTACLTPADDAGFEIDEAEVIYWGRCPACAAATFATSDG